MLLVIKISIYKFLLQNNVRLLLPLRPLAHRAKKWPPQIGAAGTDGGFSTFLRLAPKGRWGIFKLLSWGQIHEGKSFFLVMGGAPQIEASSFVPSPATPIHKLSSGLKRMLGFNLNPRFIYFLSMQCNTRSLLAVVAWTDWQKVTTVRWLLLVGWIRRKIDKSVQLYVSKLDGVGTVDNKPSMD